MGVQKGRKESTDTIKCCVAVSNKLLYRQRRILGIKTFRRDLYRQQRRRYKLNRRFLKKKRSYFTHIHSKRCGYRFGMKLIFYTKRFIYMKHFKKSFTNKIAVWVTPYKPKDVFNLFSKAYRDYKSVLRYNAWGDVEYLSPIADEPHTYKISYGDLSSACIKDRSVEYFNDCVARFSLQLDKLNTNTSMVDSQTYFFFKSYNNKTDEALPRLGKTYPHVWWSSPYKYGFYTGDIMKVLYPKNKKRSLLEWLMSL